MLQYEFLCCFSFLLGIIIIKPLAVPIGLYILCCVLVLAALVLEYNKPR